MTEDLNKLHRTIKDQRRNIGALNKRVKQLEAEKVKMQGALAGAAHIANISQAELHGRHQRIKELEAAIRKMNEMVFDGDMLAYSQKVLNAKIDK